MSYSMKKHITQSSDQPKLKGKVKFNLKKNNVIEQSRVTKPEYACEGSLGVLEIVHPVIKEWVEGTLGCSEHVPGFKAHLHCLNQLLRPEIERPA